MKIGLLHYSMPPAIGGVERIVAAHTRLFRIDGHEVILLCDGSQGEMAAEFPWLAVPGFQNTGEFHSNRDAFVSFIQLQKLGFLIVHNVLTMPFCPAATAACHVLAASALPVISWVHDLAAVNPYYVVPENDLLRQHPTGAHVVAISPERAIAYQKLTGHASVTVVPNGIDNVGELAGALLENRPKLRAALPGAFPVLFHPTRLLRRKNIGLGIQVASELKRLGFTPRLLISGAAESFSGDQAAYRKELDALVAELDLNEEIHFLADERPVAESDLTPLYAIADALFFPSEQEGFGLPMLEAGLRGLPIFASATQPLAHLATENGIVFDLATSPIEITRKISHFFSSSPSSHVRQLIRRDFDWQAIHQKHILPLLHRPQTP
ncbi:MAG: glycosyltransferase family 4 protein [Chthoniobacterales bacterium]